MSVILKQVSVSAFHYGNTKHILSWVFCLSSQNCPTLLTHVFKQHKSTNNTDPHVLSQLWMDKSNLLLPTKDVNKFEEKKDVTSSFFDKEKKECLKKFDILGDCVQAYSSMQNDFSFEIVLESDLQNLSKDKNQNRHDLQSKLETLEAFGCSMDQIQESPEILQLSLTDIVKRASALKKLGLNNISVQLLKGIRANMTPSQLQQKIKSLQPLADYSTMTRYMQEVLQCNYAEMHSIMQKIPSIKAYRNMPAFSEKVEYLRSEGLTTEDFKNYPAILCRSLSTLQLRINVIKKSQEDNKFPVSSLIVSDKQFKKFLVKYYADQKALKGFEDRNECIAKMFGVSAMIESQMHYFHNRRLATVKPRIDYLLSVGIPLEHIRNHPYILRYKKETLENALVKAKEAGIENISILHLINIIISGRVPLKPPVPKSTNYLPELLGLPQKELKKKYNHLRPLVTSNRLALKQNLDFLLDKGFTVKQVRSCPLILSHKHEEIKTILEALPHRPEMQNNLDLLQNGFMKINLMQYFLEKESNFRLSSAEIL